MDTLGLDIPFDTIVVKRILCQLQPTTLLNLIWMMHRNKIDYYGSF